MENTNKFIRNPYLIYVTGIFFDGVLYNWAGERHAIASIFYFSTYKMEIKREKPIHFRNFVFDNIRIHSRSLLKRKFYNFPISYSGGWCHT